MGAGRLIGEEETGALQHVLSTHRIPRQVVGIALCGDPDGAAVHHQLTVLHSHLALEAAMGGVVAEHVREVLHVDQVVDANHLHIRQGDGTAEGQATDAAETVDADADGHGRSLTLLRQTIKPP